MRHDGQCHCGRLKAIFETQERPDVLGVRTCQCAFCRAHGAVNISDPHGSLEIEAGANDVQRYAFALRTADFLLCKRCGVYVAAVTGQGDAIVSSVQCHGAAHGRVSRPQHYADGLWAMKPRMIASHGGARKWTPTRFVDETLAASNFGPH